MGANDFYEDISFKLIFYPQLLEWRAFAENIPTHLMKACCILEVSKRHNWHVKRVEGGGGWEGFNFEDPPPFCKCECLGLDSRQ